MGIKINHYKKWHFKKVIEFLNKLNQRVPCQMYCASDAFIAMLKDSKFDKKMKSKIALWWDNKNIVAIASPDYRLGEAYIAVLDDYKDLFVEVLDYAYENLKDEKDLRLFINENDDFEISKMLEKGFIKIGNADRVFNDIKFLDYEK